MPDVNTSPSPDLLAELLAAFGTKSKKAPASKKLPRNARPLSFTADWQMKKTGYQTWTAKARVVQLEEQVCACCGTRTTSVKDELFLLENSVAKSAWLRHEGYGIEEPDLLPVQFMHLDPRTVSFCATCASSSVDTLLDEIAHEQQQLHFGF